MVDSMEPFKRPKISNYTAIKISLYYFGILSKLKTGFILIIVFATILKNFIKSQTDQIKRLTKEAKSRDDLKKIFLQASLFNSHWAGMNFVTDFIFEKQLTQYGGYIATKVLKNVLFIDTRIETTGGEFEYYITEGGKAMAKISRFIIFSFLSKICHFGFGLYNICSLDTTKNKLASRLYISLLMILSFIKVYKMEKITEFNKKGMVIAYQKEKRITETLDNIAIIKSFNEEDHSIIKFGRTSYEWESANISFKFWSLSTDLIYNMLSATLRPGMALVAIMYANPAENAILNNNDIILYLDLLFEMLTTTNGMIKIFSDIKLSIEMTHDLIHLIKLFDQKIEEKICIDSFNDQIEIKDLVYSAKDKLIFSGVNFTIKKGEKVALFGRNGTGKSSIFKVLLGFNEFNGFISVDGISFNRLSMPEYRSLITYVPQDTKLFDESIFYNLTFGNNRSYKDVIEECKKMKIHETIMTFPNGYNTTVGEGGKLLNGGLRQKIFYTRAFLCESEIYMFDEPTNNLDVIHGQFLLEYLNDEKYKEKTFFVICHDHEIVEKFPKILHFNDGKIKQL